jgi:hypothetical protein
MKVTYAYFNLLVLQCAAKAGNLLEKIYFLILVGTVTKQVTLCVMNFISLFVVCYAYHFIVCWKCWFLVKNIIPDGKKLQTYGQCQ